MNRSIATLFIVLFGCNNVAILEGDLSMPPRPEQFTELWAVVEVMRSTTAFEVEWAGTSLEPLQLTEAREEYLFSVRTEEPGGDLHVKVRFCRTRACDFLDPGGSGAADPQSEVWFQVEEPFYIRDKSIGPTRWSETLADLPRCIPCDGGGSCSTGTCNDLTGLCETGPGECVAVPAPMDCSDVATARPTWMCFVSKCEIEGCITGTPSDYCDILDGEEIHICET